MQQKRKIATINNKNTKKTLTNQEFLLTLFAELDLKNHEALDHFLEKFHSFLQKNDAEENKLLLNEKGFLFFFDKVLAKILALQSQMNMLNVMINVMNKEISSLNEHQSETIKTFNQIQIILLNLTTIVSLGIVNGVDSNHITRQKSLLSIADEVNAPAALFLTILAAGDTDNKVLLEATDPIKLLLFLAFDVKVDVIYTDLSNKMMVSHLSSLKPLMQPYGDTIRQDCKRIVLDILKEIYPFSSQQIINANYNTEQKKNWINNALFVFKQHGIKHPNTKVPKPIQQIILKYALYEQSDLNRLIKIFFREAELQHIKNFMQLEKMNINNQSIIHFVSEKLDIVAQVAKNNINQLKK